MSYSYQPTPLHSHPSAVQAAILAEQLQNSEANCRYWENRARAGEHRMRQHECTKDSK